MSVANISVVIATFNGSRFITKQLDSIINQTLPPEEIIICDDGSTDETVSLLRRYASGTKIKIIVNEHRLGVTENFKKAATLAKRNNWLAFADQDDIWVPQKLQRLTDEMTRMDDGVLPALVYSDLAVIDKDDVITSPSFWKRQAIDPEKIRLSTLLYGNVVTGCTMMINYPMAEELYLMDDQNLLHDEWLGLIAYSMGKVKILNEALVLYRQHENNVTFSEDYKTPAFADKVKEGLKHLSGKRFLPHQFEIAKAFLLKYRARINEDKVKIIEKFISQENKNYLLQRLNRKLTYLNIAPKINN